MITYNLIDQEYYKNNHMLINELIQDIWVNKISSEKAISAIGRSHISERNSFHYTIEYNREIIGITGFYGLKNNTRLVGLNHHGILKKYRGKGFGKSTIKDLLDIIKNKHNLNIDGIIEIVPDQSIEIETIFKKMGFIKLSQDEISNIETIDELLKIGYYKTAFILKT